MLAKRIIPCLDVKNNQVVKGTKFKDHELIGDIIPLAQYYAQEGADELVFYDISASCAQESDLYYWVTEIARVIDIPFCVAGGIRDIKKAEALLNAGADKISLNSPALENPGLIDELAKRFGQQCVVIGIDSLHVNVDYQVWQYTGNPDQAKSSMRLTEQWVKEVESRGAGEIVLNCMQQDGMRHGYDIAQLKLIRAITKLPLIASGGAGALNHFASVFHEAQVDGALAASVFHKKQIRIGDLKRYLLENKCMVRL